MAERSNVEEESGLASLAQPESNDSSSAYAHQSMQEMRSGTGEDLPSYNSRTAELAQSRSRPRTTPVKELPSGGAAEEAPPHKLEVYEPALQPATEEKTETTTETVGDTVHSKTKATPSQSLPASFTPTSPPPPPRHFSTSTASGVEAEAIRSNNSDGRERDDGLQTSMRNLEVQATIKMGNNELSYKFKGQAQDVHKQSEMLLRHTEMVQNTEPSPQQSSTSNKDQQSTTMDLFTPNITIKSTDGGNKG